MSDADGSAVRSSKDDDARGDDKVRTGPLTFYKQVVAELRKVVWPTQPQLVTYFIVVMVFVLFMIAFVSLLDLGFGRLAFEIFTTSGE
ncbi:preprotein translocase subunit SecE [Nocardioides zeae]|uniref:Protein translocase subunit SecE n=1 Tax=Nocardioides imazamoxiresistens TaxID=3231893 RepID=A0ABU3PT19_9ACTN|nr:preprotein translocase subunit SecE [Nocardioides zeae]MDT9592041.1 preprotein translocase subunit SecE [Nocardioides zeae]